MTPWSRLDVYDELLVTEPTPHPAVGDKEEVKVKEPVVEMEAANNKGMTTKEEETGQEEDRQNKGGNSSGKRNKKKTKKSNKSKSSSNTNEDGIDIKSNIDINNATLAVHVLETKEPSQKLTFRGMNPSHYTDDYVKYVKYGQTDPPPIPMEELLAHEHEEDLKPSRHTDYYDYCYAKNGPRQTGPRRRNMVLQIRIVRSILTKIWMVMLILACTSTRTSTSVVAGAFVISPSPKQHQPLSTISITITIQTRRTTCQEGIVSFRSRPSRRQTETALFEICNNNHDDGHHPDNISTRPKSNNPPKKMGDPVRDATGIRPSLHPTTINALAQALKQRALHHQNFEKSLMVGDNVAALDVALRAGQIAAEAMEQRQAASKVSSDGMELTPDEQQTIAGRVVGVVMRWNELEELLRQKVQAAGWIAKYHDWDSFGVLAQEIVSGETKDDDTSTIRKVYQRIKEDPLFAMTRAECLLALFLETVEAPRLEQAKQAVPDAGKIDFLDDDRKKVLLVGDELII